jgi:hypothetical protein
MKTATRKVAAATPGAPEAIKKEAALNSLEALGVHIKETLGEAWLPRFYRERILPARTRAHDLQAAAAKPEQVEVQHTLLGVELKIKRRRISCP